MDKLMSWDMIYILALPIIGCSCVLGFKIYFAFRLRNRIREMFPDVTLNLISGLKFIYKGFTSRLNWRYQGKHTRAKTWFKLEFPHEIQQALAGTQFKLNIDSSSSPSARTGLEGLRQRCFIKSSNPMMKNLVKDAAFLSAIAQLDALSSYGNDIYLKRGSFQVELGGEALALAPDKMATFAQCCTQLFERVITAAAASNPVLLSISPIADNFTVRPGDFLNACSDEDMYDALDDVPMENDYADSENWEDDDRRALPQQSAAHEIVRREDNDEDVL